MPHQRLQDTLAELNNELANSTKLDEPTRLALEKLARDIRERLEALPPAESESPVGESTDGESGSSDEESLADQLQQYLLGIEAEHPRLTRAVNQVAAALANLGI